jgi:hypothetical protein
MYGSSKVWDNWVAYLDQVHVWHESFDLSDDLGLSGRVDLLQLDVECSLLFWLLLYHPNRNHPPMNK